MHNFQRFELLGSQHFGKILIRLGRCGDVNGKLWYVDGTHVRRGVRPGAEKMGPGTAIAEQGQSNRTNFFVSAM